MFEVAVISFTTCFSLYLLLRRYIPDILRLTSPHPKETLEYWEKNITQYEKGHHAQVVVCFLHALVATCGAFVSLRPYSFSDISEIGTLIVIEEPYYPYYVELRHFFLEITLGYFFADLLIYSLDDISKFPLLDIAHHIVAIIAYILGIYNNGGSFVMIVFQTNEISTPFLHLRYYFMQWDMKDRMLYKISEAMFVLFFILSRIIFNFYIMIAVWHGALSVVAKHHIILESFLVVCANLYYIVQCIWFYKIILMVMRRFSHSRNITMPSIQEEKNAGVKKAQKKEHIE
jgi:hypothetical protein